MNVKAIFVVMIYKGPTGYLFNGPTKEYIRVVKLGIIQSKLVCATQLRRRTEKKWLLSPSSLEFTLPKN